MKKYILKIILFFAIVTVIDLCVGFVGRCLQAHAKGGTTKELNDLVMIDKHDVLILGSSRAHHHYDSPFLTDTLGLDVYNAGYDGNGVILAYGILEMVFKHYKPELVIFDVEPAFDIIVYDKDNQRKRYISDLKPYFDNPEVGAVIKDISTEEWYKVHSGMIRYNTDIIKIAIDNVLSRETPTKGFEPLGGKIENRQIDTSNGRHTGINHQIDKVKLKYVEKLIDLAQNHNVPIVLIASPKYGSSDVSIYSPIISICEKKGVPFYNYYSNNVFMSHPDWFKEPMHLNATGAREYSLMLVDIINSYISHKE